MLSPTMESPEDRTSGILHSCPDCSFQTSSIRKLGRHRSVNHAGIKYKCEHCDFVTGYQSNYYRHRKQVHSGAHQSLVCPKCDFYAASSEGLTVHMSQMHKEQWLCTECGVQLNTKSQWQEHNRTFHGKPVSSSCSSGLEEPGKEPGELDPSGTTQQQQEAALRALQAASSAKMAEMMTAAFLPLMQAMMPQMNMNMMNQGMLPLDLARSLLNFGMVPGLNVGASNGGTPSYLHGAAIANQVNPNTQQRNNSMISQSATSEESGDRKSEEIPCSDFGSDDGQMDEKPLKIELGTEADGDVEGKVLKCDACPYHTQEVHRYKKHLRCHQTTADTKCKLCDFQTVYSWNLDRHVRCHNTPGRYMCLKCSFSQNTRQSMSFHLLHHHVANRVDAETQTDGDSEDFPFFVDVDSEPFIWEIHAVRFNPDIQGKRVSSSSQGSSVNFTGSKREEESGEDSAAKRSSVVSTHSEAQRDSVSPAENRLTKKYLSEQEAIETPTEERDIKDLEKDPDIQSRTCSICGYQGKWISEMIRHKRVHTNERPFRCKYCSRTSKWKADLIRHVAKVHNIRVVSKYSRSKTFDSDPMVMRALKEAHGFVDQDAMQEDKLSEHMNVVEEEEERSEAISDAKSSAVETCPKDGNDTNTGSSWKEYMLSGPSEDGDTIYWCKVCSYETRDVHLFRAHTGKHENKRPYQCSECGYRSNWSSDVYKHIRGRNCGNGLATVVRHSPKQRPSSKEFRVRQDQNASKKEKFTCGLCGFGDSKEETLVSHLKEEHDLARFSCSLCKFNSIDAKIVEFHLQFQHQNATSKIVDHIAVDESASISTDLSKRKASPDNLEALYGGVLKRSKQEKKGSLSASSVASVSSLSGPSESPRINSESPELRGSLSIQDAGLHGTLTLEDGVIPEPRSEANCQELDLSSKKGGLGDVSDVVSDFSAILNAAGEDLNLNGFITNQISMVNRTNTLLSHLESNINTKQPKGMLLDQSTDGFEGNEGSESEAEIEDEEAYIHGGEDSLDQGLEFVRQAPREIQKVSVFVNGESKKMWKCRFCEHTSKRRANVRSHEKKHFKKNPVGLLRCPRCSYRGDKRSLNAHFRVHSGSAMPERFPCSKCPANFRSRHNLIKHMEFHGAQFQFKCPSCDYAVTQEGHLAEHRRAHSCSDENSTLVGTDSFSKASPHGQIHETSALSKNVSLTGNTLSPRSSPLDLATLLATQTKPKRHCCSATNCDAKFSDNTQLKRHEQYHSEETKHPHACSLCNYSVPYAINLIKHLRSHHDIPSTQIEHISKGTEVQYSGDSLTERTEETDVHGEREKNLEVHGLALQNLEESDDEERVQVTPNSDTGSLKIKINLGLGKVKL